MTKDWKHVYTWFDNTRSELVPMMGNWAIPTCSSHAERSGLASTADYQNHNHAVLCREHRDAGHWPPPQPPASQYLAWLGLWTVGYIYRVLGRLEDATKRESPPLTNNLPVLLQSQVEESSLVPSHHRDNEVFPDTHCFFAHGCAPCLRWQGSR